MMRTGDETAVRRSVATSVAAWQNMGIDASTTSIVRAWLRCCWRGVMRCCWSHSICKCQSTRCRQTELAASAHCLHICWQLSLQIKVVNLWQHRILDTSWQGNPCTRAPCDVAVALAVCSPAHLMRLQILCVYPMPCCSPRDWSS